MRELKVMLLSLVMAVALFIAGPDLTQAAGQSQASGVSQGVPDQPDYLEWPIPAADHAYATIDGKHMWQYVKEQAVIAERYRDNGHPQLWGRIVGTSGDVEDIQWLLDKYKQIGLSDVHAQTMNLFLPQWSEASWEVTAIGDGKRVPLSSAQPPYGSPGTDGKELDLEVAYVGLGSEADFAGRDVRGKAVLLIQAGTEFGYNAAPAILKRAQNHGAAAIFTSDERGGNFNAQAYRAYTTVPTFDLGTQDAEKLRDMVGSAQAGDPPHIKIRLDGKWAPAKTALVWGTLPGQTDETIYVIAHRDGWFDAAGDNASGVASMLGLAEYFAKVPKSKRRRTIIFIGTDGHHQQAPGGFGREWLVANRDKYFSKTALMINDEHPSEVLTHSGAVGGWSDTIDPLQWYAGGSSRPQLQKIAFDAFHEFGLPVWAEPSKIPPGGDLGRFYWFLPGVVAQRNSFMYMHTTGDTPENVPWTGLEAVTRAYAKIIDEVNELPLSELQRPAAADPTPATSPNVAIPKCTAWVQDSSQGCGPKQ